MEQIIQETSAVINSILASLDKFERPLEILLITAILLLDRHIKQNTQAISPTVSTPTTSSSKTSTKRKKEYEAEMKQALELYFSGKPLNEMTDEEKSLYDKASAYFGG